MKKTIFLTLILSFILEFVMFNFIPYAFNDITFVYPMLFLTSSLIFYPYLDSHNVYIFIILTIFYSAIALNNIILGLTLFTIIYLLNRALMDKSLCLRFVLSIIIYDLSYYVILVIFAHYQLVGMFYLYKLIRSLIFNIIYLSIFNFVLKKVKP